MSTFSYCWRVIVIMWLYSHVVRPSLANHCVLFSFCLTVNQTKLCLLVPCMRRLIHQTLGLVRDLTSWHLVEDDLDFRRAACWQLPTAKKKKKEKKKKEKEKKRRLLAPLLMVDDAASTSDIAAATTTTTTTATTTTATTATTSVFVANKKERKKPTATSTMRFRADNETNICVCACVGRCVLQTRLLAVDVWLLMQWLGAGSWELLSSVYWFGLELMYVCHSYHPPLDSFRLFPLHSLLSPLLDLPASTF